MKYFIENLTKDESFEKKISIVFSYNNSKCEVINGHVINMLRTNVSFIEPHRIIITMKFHKLLLIYYDKDNLFLYNRSIPLDLKKLDTLLKSIKKEVS